MLRAGAESVMTTVGFDHGARGSGERTRADATNNMLTPSIRPKALPSFWLWIEWFNTTSK